MELSKKARLRVTEALQALDLEIEAVLQNPSSEVLVNGEYQPRSGSNEQYDYKFRTATQSLRFVESVKSAIEDKVVSLPVVVADAEYVTLRFDHDKGEVIKDLAIEWENDFVLRKVRETLVRLTVKEAEIGLMESLWHPEQLQPFGEGLVAVDDGNLNANQAEAVQKSLDMPVSFIWGPPGTGKTSTLGYVMANAVLYGKSVLFASNTNRAVDVGCLSALQSLHSLGYEKLIEQVTRFGEPALDDPLFEQCYFGNQIDGLVKKRVEQYAYFRQVIDEYRSLSERAEKQTRDGYSVDNVVRERMAQLLERLESWGGIESVEDRIEEPYVPNELVLLRSKKLICTTLARVCTSDLFAGLRFDMVVIDEASMASLPYIMALASKSDASLVIAGDPMQLPPIAITQDADARLYLEEDAFSSISGAKSTSDLFSWHDTYPSFTSFFDIQYRMRDDMAGLISSVFYEGRLRSSEERIQATEGRAASVRLVDSSDFSPVLEKKEGGRGFQPENKVHGQLVTDVIRRYVVESGIPLEEIGVIVPFRAGVYSYRKWLRERGLDGIEVGTIHTYQGREKRVIIFDTIMTGELTQYGRIRHYTVRPFDEDKNGLSVPRLLNVALSRAKDRLILVADMRHIEAVYKNKFLGRLMQKAAELGRL
jgi:hypothetical protein